MKLTNYNGVQIVEQGYEILAFPENPEKLIEMAGRTCYKSEDRITDTSAGKFCRMISKRGHLSVVEHASATVKFITDRGVTHELVRHRLASFSQESTRYVDYTNKGMKVIQPVELEDEQVKRWRGLMWLISYEYYKMRKNGVKPEIARAILPNSLAAEIVVTANFREWQHIFKLRCDKTAHPQIRALMIPLRDEFIKRAPNIFRKEQQ
jgi:thymidylate synthase (FAD)